MAFAIGAKLAKFPRTGAIFTGLFFSPKYRKPKVSPHDPASPVTQVAGVS